MTNKELRGLARSLDFPLVTPEINQPNDFYGHASMLKKYVGLKSTDVVKAAIEHSPIITSFVWDVEAMAPLPAMLCCAKRRLPILRESTNKAVFPIGPYIHYCTGILDEEQVQAERRRLGKNLLAFPVHSTHWVDNACDFEAFCRELAQYKSHYASIRVCLSWKNILKGHDAIFMKHGYECVTAGHMYDRLFTRRLKSLLEVTDVTVSNSVGTHIGYSIYCNKPHFLIDVPYERSAPPEILKRDGVLDFREQVYIDVPPLFADHTETISSRQYEVVDHYWGLSLVKTASELREILSIAEDMFQQGSGYYLETPHLQIEQAMKYASADKFRQTLVLLEHAEIMYPELPDLAYLKAVACHKLGKRVEALQQVKRILRSFPGHGKTLELLKALELGGSN